MQTSGIVRIGVISDIHYAGASEQSRGDDFEYRALKNPLMRGLIRFHRRHIWLRHPLGQNHLLSQFLNKKAEFDFVAANGDFSCNSGFIGVADQPAFESAIECLTKLRSAFPGRFYATAGDHEFGKIGLTGKQGRMMLKSFYRARDELGLKMFWQFDLGVYLVMGVTSSLLALPSLESDLTPSEKPEWIQLREAHLREILDCFASLAPDRKVIFFCHDPTALPYLFEVDAVREKIGSIEATIVGHLHSSFVFWASKLLAGMPRINFLGHSARKFSSALNRARVWRHFKIVLCPAMAGIELLKDGGYLTIEIDPMGATPLAIQKHRIVRGARN